MNAGAADGSPIVVHDDVRRPTASGGASARTRQAEGVERCRVALDLDDHAVAGRSRPRRPGRATVREGVDEGPETHALHDAADGDTAALTTDHWPTGDPTARTNPTG